jgi:two-component system, sensor histidine kinase LadS
MAATGIATSQTSARSTPDVPPTPGAPARQGLPLDGTYSRMTLANWATQWVDEAGTADAVGAMNAARQGRFVRANETPILLHPDRAIWYRVEVQSMRRTGNWYVRSNSPSVDEISLHWQASDGSWRREVAGDRIAPKEWPQRHRLPLFELPEDVLQEPDGTFELWVRVAHERVPFFAHIDIISQKQVRWGSEIGYWLFGLFYGMVVVALAVCAQQVLTFRDRAFAAYAGITASMALLQGTLTGLAGQYLFDTAPLYAISGLYFAYSACNLERYVPRLAWGIRGWIALGFAIVLVHMIWPTRLMFLVSNVYMPVSMVMTVMATILAHQRGERWAKWILLGIAPVVIAAAFPLARNHGLISTGFWTQYGLMMAAAIELIILMIVLNRRGHELHESSVRERALLSTDALTGVTHESLFLERLHGSVVRARRYGHQAGLLLITLTNHPWFQKEHGQQAAERALVLSASRIRAVARDVDTVTRVGDNEFVLLIEGPVTAPGMVHTATKVLARSLQPADALPIGAQLKISITMAMLPDKPGMKIEDETEEGLSAQNRLAWLRARAASRLEEPHAKAIQALNF